jgi:hypothetical protein
MLTLYFAPGSSSMVAHVALQWRVPPAIGCELPACHTIAIATLLSNTRANSV